MTARIEDAKRRIKRVAANLTELESLALDQLSSKTKLGRAVLARKAICQYLAKNGAKPPKVA